MVIIGHLGSVRSGNVICDLGILINSPAVTQQLQDAERIGKNWESYAVGPRALVSFKVVTHRYTYIYI